MSNQLEGVFSSPTPLRGGLEQKKIPHAKTSTQGKDVLDTQM